MLQFHHGPLPGPGTGPVPDLSLPQLPRGATGSLKAMILLALQMVGVRSNMSTLEDLKARRKRLAKEHMYEMGFIGLVVGAIMTFYGVLATAYPDHRLTPAGLEDRLGNWSIYLFIVGALLAGLSGYFFYQTVERMRRFESLFETASKKRFRDNLEDLDSLSYYHLPSRYRHRLMKQKERFGLK